MRIAKLALQDKTRKRCSRGWSRLRNGVQEAGEDEGSWNWYRRRSPKKRQEDLEKYQ